MNALIALSPFLSGLFFVCAFLLVKREAEEHGMVGMVAVIRRHVSLIALTTFGTLVFDLGVVLR